MNTLETQLKKGEQSLARIWKVTAFRGVLAIAFSVVILVWPNIGLTTLIALFGAFALVSGIATIVASYKLSVQGGQRGWLVFEGLVGIAVGVAVFVWPDLTAVGLLYAIAAWAVVLGCIELALSFVLPYSGGRSVLAMLGGVVSIAFGAIIFIHPGAGAVAVLALIAALLLITGIMQIALAIELRHVAGEFEQRKQPRSTTKPATQA